MLVRVVKRLQVRIQLGYALRIKSAELWLRLGLPLQALLEPQELPPEAQQHPWAASVLRRAFREGHRPEPNQALPQAASDASRTALGLPGPPEPRRLRAASHGGRGSRV